MLAALFDDAARVAASATDELALREDAVRLLGFAGPRQSVGVLLSIVDSKQPEPLQAASVRAVAVQSAGDRDGADFRLAWADAESAGGDHRRAGVATGLGGGDCSRRRTTLG